MGFTSDRYRADKQNMNHERVELWLEAMESGRYPQCFGYIHDYSYKAEKLRVCAVGVAYAVYLEAHNFAVTSQTMSMISRQDVSSWYGVADVDLLIEILPGGDFTSVICLNDTHKQPFPSIAQQIRKEYF